MDLKALSPYSEDMRKLHHPLKNEIELANVLYALGDPVRIEIVKNLSKAETTCSLNPAKIALSLLHKRSCKSICTKLELSKSTLSHHFRILREAGLIWCEKDGIQYINRLR